jgi:hydrogenase expression/formation protein HypC
VIAVCLPRIGHIVEIEGSEAVIAQQEASPIRISLLCVPTAKVGDHVMVHAGYAIRLLDADEAADRRNLIRSVTDGDSDSATTNDG